MQISVRICVNHALECSRFKVCLEIIKWHNLTIQLSIWCCMWVLIFSLISFLVQSPNEVYTFKRPVDLSEMMSGQSGAQTFFRSGLRSTTPKRDNCVSLLSANQVVRALPPNKVPLKEIYPKGQRSNHTHFFRYFRHSFFWPSCVCVCESESVLCVVLL